MDVGMQQAVKKHFNICDKLPTPNIYWFHCDGMLSFDVMEDYFGDSQQHFADELKSMGFSINRNAGFEANHSTMYAVPALMSPHYYDAVLADMINNGEAAAEEDLFIVRQYNELFMAFEQKGYMTLLLGTKGRAFPVSVGHCYDYAPPIERLYPLRWFRKLKGKQSNIANKYLLLAPRKYQNMYKCLEDAIKREADAPKFCLLKYNMAHTVFDRLADGQTNPGNHEDILSYPQHHTYSTKLLLVYVRYILNNDAESVIVLQSDHGLHGLSEQHIMERLNIPKEQARDLWNSTMSAIRVPQTYADGTEAHTANPLNISRWLVNKFVGDNYPYIQDGEAT